MEAARGIGVRDVKAADFITAYAQHLKNSGKMDLPRNWEVVKTATFKELAPYSADWYYVRAASIARKVYLRQNTGVGALRRVYGGPARRNTTLPGTIDAVPRNIVPVLSPALLATLLSSRLP
jgi:small subunit ribosomal protein S19e